jgi:pilus assembly protein CpaF
MSETKEVYKTLRRQIFDALDPEAIQRLDDEQLGEQLSKAIEMLVDKESFTVPLVLRHEFVKSFVD